MFVKIKGNRMLVLKSLLTVQKQDRQKDIHIRPD